MKTYLITKEKVCAYLLDYWTRITEHAAQYSGSLEDLRWVLLGQSGYELFKILHGVLKDNNEPTLCAPIIASYNRDDQTIGFKIRKNENEWFELTEEKTGRMLRDKRIVVFDSSVHSGTSMLALIENIQQYSPADISSYSLVLKRGSDFIPNHFGILIHDWDRALFLLDRLPNNRMRFGETFRKITFNDQKDKKIAFPGWLGNPENFGWGNYLNTNSQAFVCINKANVVQALIVFQVDKKGICHVEKLRADPQYKHDDVECDRLVVAPLLRWAMTYARHCCCSKFRINCKSNAVDSYKKLGFEEAEDSKKQPSGFAVMEKRILYNVPFREDPIHDKYEKII